MRCPFLQSWLVAQNSPASWAVSGPCHRRRRLKQKHTNAITCWTWSVSCGFSGSEGLSESEATPTTAAQWSFQSREVSTVRGRAFSRFDSGPEKPVKQRGRHSFTCSAFPPLQVSRLSTVKCSSDITLRSGTRVQLAALRETLEFNQILPNPYFCVKWDLASAPVKHGKSAAVRLSRGETHRRDQLNKTRHFWVRVAMY